MKRSAGCVEMLGLGYCGAAAPCCTQQERGGGGVMSTESHGMLRIRLHVAPPTLDFSCA